MLDLTQADLAQRVNCSLSMLRKIERDERRPSEQLAILLADHLAVDDSQRGSFLQLARGSFIEDLQDPIRSNGSPIPQLIEYSENQAEQAPFVARERELILLSEHLDRAMQGEGRVVFVSGEAGQGKTSLLYEFARRSVEAQPGLLVAGGSSDVYTGQGDPLLPFRDIFRLLAGDMKKSGMQGMLNQQLATRLSGARPVFVEILLEYGPHLIDTLIPAGLLETHLMHDPTPHPKRAELLLRLKTYYARQSLSSGQELRQDGLFEEISTSLHVLSQQQPLLLILDDLHWIDHSSAALLGHLIMRLKHSPILIIGSYRPEDLAQVRRTDERSGQSQHPLQEVLSESLRQFGYNRIDLDHSGPDEEIAFVEALLDIYDNEFSEAFRKHLARLTEGHPLFVVELLRDMRERGDIVQGDDGRWKEVKTMRWKNLPARVEGVIEKRITRLPRHLVDLLSVASVQGETFFAEVIAAVRQVDPIEMTRRLSADLDRQHRLIYEQCVKHAGAERLSQYQFRHQLFQKYIYERLASAERMYLHEAVGDALERLFVGREEELPANQLARHFLESRLNLKASKYLLLAGQQAVRVLAFDEAAIYFERGISELLNLAHTPETSHLEYELRLALAHALWHSGRVIEAVDAYKETILIARAIDDPHALACAALAYEEPRWRLNLNAELSQQFMREALAVLGEEQSGLRVRLLVGLARSLLAYGEEDELRTMVDEALRIARRIEDPLALCDALRIKAHIDRRPERTHERLAAIQEMIATAESIGDQERLADGFDLYVYDLLEQGQIDLVDQAIEAQSQIAHEIKQPFQIHVAAVFQTMRAIMRGEFDKAERLAREAAEISRQIGIAELDGIFGMHMFTIRREQGRIHEVMPIVRLIVANHPESSAWRPGLALIYRILGQKEQCKAIFENLVSEGFAFYPRDSLWVATLAYLSEVCAYLGDVDRAATLYPLLLPYDGRNVVVGGATACYGAAGRYLGMLAATMSDWELAERHFQGALNLDEHMGAWPWLAHSRFAYATMLLCSGRGHDRPQVNTLLDDALNAARRMGMAYLVEQVTDVQVHYEISSS